MQAARRTEDEMFTRDVASLSSSDKETDSKFCLKEIVPYKGKAALTTGTVEAIEDEWNCEDKDSSIGSELYNDEEPSPINSRREAGKFR